MAYTEAGKRKTLPSPATNHRCLPEVRCSFLAIFLTGKASIDASNIVVFFFDPVPMLVDFEETLVSVLSYETDAGSYSVAPSR